MHLWDVQIDDEIVIKAKEKISQTLQENLEVISLAVNVYDDFLFILKERERIEVFISKENFTREDFQKEIDMYQASIIKIRETMPFEIRMNMFLIKCSDINNALCDECEGLMKLILDKVEQHVFQKMAPMIQAEVKQIKEDLATKAGDSRLLVSFESKLENVKNVEKTRLMGEYNDLIEWLMMLNRNPR